MGIKHDGLDGSSDSRKPLNAYFSKAEIVLGESTAL